MVAPSRVVYVIATEKLLVRQGDLHPRAAGRPGAHRPPQSNTTIAAKRRRMVFFRSLSEQLQRLKLCAFQCRDLKLTLKLREYENIAERAGKSLASEDLHSAIAPRH